MLERVNHFIFNEINGFAGYNLVIDMLAKIIAEYLPLLFILPLVLHWFSRRDGGSRIDLLFTGYCAFLAMLINFLITLFYFHPRPFMLHMGKTLIEHGPETSFPSDHATFMFSIAFAFIAFKGQWKTGVILSFLALFGGIARVFVGVHFPLDIIGSLGVGLISTIIIFALKDILVPINKRIVGFYRNLLVRLNFR